MLKSNRFAVLVPLLSTVIARGSAVVVAEEEWEALVDGITPSAMAYYEGDLGDRFGHSFADKLLHAAGRCGQNYPTIAKTPVSTPGAFREVGRYDLTLRLMKVTDRKGLKEWAPDSTQWLAGEGLSADRYLIADRGRLDQRHPFLRPAFWSTRLGWVRVTQATTFDAGQVLRFRLPDGKAVGWVPLNDVHRLQAA